MHCDYTGKMMYNRAQFYISTGDSPAINYTTKVPFPLLTSRQRTTASGFNNMVVIPNGYYGANGGSFIHFPGIGISDGTYNSIYGGIYNASLVNQIFNFSKNTSSSLVEGDKMFYAYPVNTSSYLYALECRYEGWYKIEVSIGSSNTPAVHNQFVNIYKVKNGSYVLANGNHDAISTSYCNRLITVYGNNLYGINQSGEWPQSSYRGYGFVYVYINKDECLVGRMNGADSATRVSTFQLGLCYNSAGLILR